MALRAALGAGRGRLAAPAPDREHAARARRRRARASCSPRPRAATCWSPSPRASPRAPRRSGSTARCSSSRSSSRSSPASLFGMLPALLARATRLARAQDGEASRATAGARAPAAARPPDRRPGGALVHAADRRRADAAQPARSCSRSTPASAPEHVLTDERRPRLVALRHREAARAVASTTLLPRVKAQPGVVSAALGSTFPLDGDSSRCDRRLPDRGPRREPPAEAAPQVDFRIASPDYFDDARHAPPRGPGLHRRRRRRGARRSPSSTSRWRAASGAAQTRSASASRSTTARPGARSSASWATSGSTGSTARPTDEIYCRSPSTRGSRPACWSRDARPTRSRSPRWCATPVRAIDPEQPVADVRTLEEVRAESLASPRLTAIAARALRGAGAADHGRRASPA